MALLNVIRRWAFRDGMSIREITRPSSSANLRCCLDRGYDGTDNLRAGHIRWGKAIKGLTGKLGEFTARYVGPAARLNHLIWIETEGGAPAHGYATSTGDSLAPELIVSNIRATAAIW